MASFMISCGKKRGNKADSLIHVKQVSLMLAEGQCLEKPNQNSTLANEIESLFLEEKMRYPHHFFFISPPHYSDKSPLILSMKKMEETFKLLKNDSFLNLRAQDLYGLYIESRRYEDQKCQFKQLAEKKKNDIRPRLNLSQSCYEKYQSEICPDQEYGEMSPEREKWVRDNAVALCQSFSKKINCEAEYSLHLLKNTVGEMIKKYSQRFHNERYLPLFKLNPNHLKFHCHIKNDKTVMTIKILMGTYEREFLENVLQYVENVWRNKKISIKFELVESYSSDVVMILPSLKGTSYVPESNNRLIYLSTAQDIMTTKRILAHEFGHVLGFPDCYIEFFDYSKKELIYYEISKEIRNIMCSLKEDTQVDEPYFSQLIENSCLFN